MAKRRQPPTRSGLLAEARHVVLPKGIVSSGFPAVEATCRRLGLSFDSWQADLNRCILGKDSSGLFAADLAVFSIPRQVGKTWDIGALVFALCIINPGTTAVWTAHRFKVARETFNALKAIALSEPLTAHIDPDAVYTAAGNESITFRNGSRIVFAARERGAIRGFSEVDVLVLDEGQILTENALADLVPTTNQAKNPLIIVMGTPPKPADPSEVFTRLRTEALSAESEDVLYVEFSADQGCDPDDRAQWHKANPSFPKRTSARAILRLRKILSLADFVREALGVWDGDGRRLIMPNWPVCSTEGPPPRVAALGLAVDQDRMWLSVGASSAGSVKHLGSVRRARLDLGRASALADVARIQAETGCLVTLVRKGPAGSLESDLVDLGVTVTPATLDDYVNACADLFDAVEAATEDARTVEHGNYDDLNAAVGAADKRMVGERFVWSRRSGEVSMLEACTLAWRAAGQKPTPPPAPPQAAQATASPTGDLASASF